MRHLRFILLAFCGLCSAKATDVIRFLEIDYVAAYQSGTSRSDILNEFLPRGEKLKSWKTLLAIRYYRSAKSIEDATLQWATALQASDTPGAAIEELKDEVSDRARERIYNLAIRPRGDAYLEINKWRFVKTEDGLIISYQFARRVNPRDEKELMDTFMSSSATIEALKQLKDRPEPKRDRA